MNILTKQFVNVIFDKDDWTCMGPYYQTKTFPVTGLLHENQEYFSINAIKKKTTRKIMNVTKLRTFLFEMDEDIHGNPIPMKEQIRLVKECGLPWSTMVSSASKSIHFLLALEEPLQDRPIYTAYFEAIRHALLQRGIKVDKGCKDPSRFSRAPFGINEKTDVVKRKPNKEDRVQKLLRVKSRVNIKEVDAWLEAQGFKADDYLKIPTNRPVSDGMTSNATVEWKFDTIAKNFMRNEEHVQGNKNNYEHKMAWFLFGAGCTKDEIDAIFEQKWGSERDHRDTIGSAERASVKCNPIYISTPEEQREWYKKQDDLRLRESLQSGFKRDLPPEVAEIIEEENINLYETIGTEYYKINPVDRRLILWSKTMFEKLYGSNMIPPRNYDLKGYKPDYLSKEFPVELAANLKTRNVFIRPTYKINSGNWSAIEAALRHVFKEQYNLILTYCAISIAFPEAKLPIIWLLGPEGKGKSAAIAIIKLLVGERNSGKVNNGQLQSDFDGFLAEKQLLVGEEIGYWDDPKVVINKLKDWSTETMDVTVNPKYGKQYDTPVHAKFIFTSNYWDSIPLEGEATRFWIVDLQDDPTHVYPNFYDRIKDEIGHFAHYLIEEIVPTLKLNSDGTLDTTNRLYFHPDQYHNSSKSFVKKLSKGPVYDGIMEVCSDFFEKFSDEDECWFDLKSLREACDWKFKSDPSKSDIKIFMKNEYGMEPTSPLNRPDSFRWVGNTEELRPTRRSQWYCLKRQDVLGDDVLFSSDVKYY